MIVNYASSIVNKLEALLTGDARVIIYYRHVFIVQAKGLTKLITKCRYAKCRGALLHKPSSVKTALTAL
jgi:hypothetical protein